MDESLRVFGEFQRQNHIRRDALIKLLILVYERQLDRLAPWEIRRRIALQQQETIDDAQQWFPPPGIELLLNTYRASLRQQSYEELATLAGEELRRARS